MRSENYISESLEIIFRKFWKTYHFM